MQGIGNVKSITRDFITGKAIVAVQFDSVLPQELQNLSNQEKYQITIDKPRKKRSLDANGMLWACIGEIAATLNVDKWQIYLQMLKRYGKYTYIVVKENVVDAVKRQWRECEVIGEIDIHGSKGIQMLCYFGSSTYDSKEFSVLLNGVIAEMQDIGLQPPPRKEMRKALERLEKNEQNKIGTG